MASFYASYPFEGGGGGGTVTAVTASAPLSSSGGTTPNISETQSNTSTDGYLSSTDWNIFNNKQSTITTGNLTDAGTDGITVTGGTSAVIGSGTSISQHVADTTHNGYVNSTDWNTFNNKQAGPLTGDVTTSGAAATIANLAVTNAKIANATINLTTKVTSILPASNGGSPPVTIDLYVDKNRTDSFTPDGSFARPFATIGAAISQVITNGDNSTKPYTIYVTPGGYSETLSFNSTTLTNLVISANISASTPLQDISVTGITSTSNNTQLATLIFNGLTINGNLNLTGDVNGTNFGSSQILFSSCQFNNSAGTLVLNNVNNVNFYNCQFQGSGSVATFTNVAFGYMNGAEGFIGGTTLHLVDNPGGNVPSQYSGNYFLVNQSKFYGTLTIDAGSELDSLTSYFGSTSVITNNGTIHSWNTGWDSATTAVTLNNGSTTRLRGDSFFLPPIVNSGATLTNQGEFMPAVLDFSQVSTPSNPTGGHDKLYFKSDDNLYGLNSSGTEVLIGPLSTPVSLRYYSSTSSLSGTLATVVYATQDYDTNSLYTSGSLQIPAGKAGKYQINAALLVSGIIALNNTLILEIQKNSTVISRTTEYAGGAETAMKAVVSDIINLAVGDTIRIQASSSMTSPVIVSSNFDNYFSLCRVG